MLTPSVQYINVPLTTGVNTIDISTLSTGSVPIATVEVQFPSTQIVEGQQKEIKKALGLPDPFPVISGFRVTVGFPQIAICQSLPARFPCRNRLSNAESALHVLEAQSIPPPPITVPLKPSYSTGNPLRPFYPRLLTIDRLNATSRRNQSILRYQECPISGEERDEYPPSVFLENFGSGHLKYINGSDNSSSGSSFGLQLRQYRIVPNSPSYYLDNGDVVEFLVIQ